MRYCWNSLSLLNTYSSALFTTSSAGTLQNAAYSSTNLAVYSSSEQVTFTFFEALISSSGISASLPRVLCCVDVGSLIDHFGSEGLVFVRVAIYGDEFTNAALAG